MRSHVHPDLGAGRGLVAATIRVGSRLTGLTLPVPRTADGEVHPPT